MKKITRPPIKLLARHSDWRPEELGRALDEHVRADAARWRWLLRLLLPAIGIGFLACGILFFFAYNWADIPKFGKLGIAAGAVIIPAFLSVVPSFSALTQKMLITAAAFLVGPLFGVFGQVYQTGANAYDLFFAWALFIVAWVMVANFGPLWVLFLTLVSTSIFLYSEQIATGWGFVMVNFVLFSVNAFAAAVFIFLDERTKRFEYPGWLKKTTALAAACFGTVCCWSAIIEVDERVAGLFYLVPVLAVFVLAGWAAMRSRQLFYLTLLALAGIAIVAAIIIRVDMDIAGFLLAAFWVIGATTGSIILLNNLRKAWRHD